ncbi:MAG: membrane integrity-associated transporter subunit PqiC [Rhodobacteraceae bacterium]|nr:membrane integrity-associated transporter subunit PqiC [Paracoccaceae bacterium]
MIANRRHVLALLGIGLGLAGCANNTPSALYGLTAADFEMAAPARKSRQVLVPRPRALKALDSDHIAVVDSGPIYSYFPKAAWADTLPSVVQSKIVETLEGTQRLRGVGFPGDGLLIDYQLQTELRAFALHIDGRPRAVVEISARLLNDRNGRTVATKVFRTEVPSGGSTVDQAVAALNRAGEAVFRDIASWALQKI